MTGAISQRLCEILHLMTHQHAVGQWVAAEERGRSGPRGLSRLSGRSGGRQRALTGSTLSTVREGRTDTAVHSAHWTSRSASAARPGASSGRSLKSPSISREKAAARSRSRHRRSTLAPRDWTFVRRTFELLHTPPGLPGDLDTPGSRFSRSAPAARPGRQLREW
jgi:hypothetical protein